MKKVILGLALALGVLPFAGAQAGTQAGAEAAAPAVFELSTEMMRFADPTTELFLGWQRNVNSAFQVGLDAASGPLGLEQPERKIERGAVLALFSGASLIVNQAISLTAHDQRHMDTARSLGCTGVGLVTNDTSAAPLSIWLFFVEAFNVTVEPGLYTYDPPPTMTDAQSARIAGAGLDTNLLTALRAGRKIDDGAGHVTDLAPYLLNKLWGINYFMETGPTSDAQNYMVYVQNQGATTVTQQNVIVMQAGSCLVSGGFLALVRGTWQYIAGGERSVRPLSWDVGPAHVFWPEVTTWLNAQNVSLQVTLDAAWGDRLFFRAGADVPVLIAVSSNPDITVGTGIAAGVIRAGLEVTTNFAGVPFLLGTLSVAVDRHFSIGLEWHYGQGATMREAREYPLGPGASASLRAAL